MVSGINVRIACRPRYASGQQIFNITIPDGEPVPETRLLVPASFNLIPGRFVVPADYPDIAWIEITRLTDDDSDREEPATESSLESR